MTDPALEPEPAKRFRVAQSWWIAAELMRRHQGLMLIETHPGGGQYDCLSIVSVTGYAPETVIDLNRDGRIHVHRRLDPSVAYEPLTWADVMSHGGPREVIEQLEAVADLGPKPAATHTTAFTIGLRLAAELLSRGVNDRAPWDVRNEQFDSSGDEGGPNGYVTKFAGSRAAAAERRADDLLNTPGYRYWGVFRGSKVVAVIDTDGMLHSATGSLDVMALYTQRARAWEQTASEALRIAGLR